MNNLGIQQMIKYKSGYRYQLIEETYVKTEVFPKEDIRLKYLTLYQGGYLCIKEGYCWDGASGPAIDTKNFMRGSLIHDALYQLLREGVISQDWRGQADKELRRACLKDGMSKIRAWWVYKVVRSFAKRCANADHKRKILTAP